MAEWRRRVELAFLGAVRRSRLPRLHFDESAFTPAFWQSPTGEAVLANRSEAQVAVFRHIAGQPRGRLFALVGERGVGKTRLAVSLVVQVCIDETFGANDATPGRNFAMLRSVMEFFFDLREAYGDNAPEREASVLRRYCEPDILVLDDMQDRGETQWEQRTLALLIDKRYRDRKDTILIANIDPAKFEAHIGAAISDRIRECGGVIECDWESFRGTK